MNTTLKVPASISQATVQTEYGNYKVAADGTVSVDSRAVPSLIAAGYVQQDDDLPAGSLIKAGIYTATADDATANTTAIVTGLSTISAMSVMILRASISLPSAGVSKANGTITVADNASTYVLTAGDLIHWIAVGTV